MNNLQTLTTERLRLLLSETEATLVELKAELERREELAQADEVAHLEEYMENAEVSLKSIRNFLQFLSSDMSGKK